ncbi:MAG: PilT/PilU family type 4a pilus ATPase [Patescibacteria group bacterium]|nr:PilT/PilU family type 4a pilus ATPase [Patescibacteria group bacterium]
MTIKELLKIATDKKASDLHLIVGVPPAIRFDGSLEYIESQKPITKKEMEAMVTQLLSAKDLERFKVSKELDIGTEEESFRYRINLHFEKGNMGLVARVITDHIPTLDEINLPKVVYNLLDLKQGLILLTGPTGCGKSTSLAAMLNYINHNRFANIITFEDPIEYLFKPEKSIIIQRQLGSDMLSFAEGLKHALRQDPNVIMVGEMRDLETIATTITLAETGHLVLATLHTYNAAQTIDRIIDIFPPHQQNQVKQQLSMTLAGVISQRLVPKIGGGRTAAREILINTPAIANLIRENKISQIKTIIETSSREGMLSLDQNIQHLYKEKLIDKETARAQMDNPELLNKFKLI